uniref:Uncharacterized protein n=1 Tax=Anguilla anguilla TaxID=7936 RepID=A0A0E9XAF9_ANGAN
MFQCELEPTECFHQPNFVGHMQIMAISSVCLRERHFIKKMQDSAHK